MFAETTTLDDIWNQLQAPGYPTVIEPGYWMLLTALDMGWNVAEPGRNSTGLCAPNSYALSPTPRRSRPGSLTALPRGAPVCGRSSARQSGSQRGLF